MIATAFLAAKQFQPTIIYIDEAERVWPSKKKGKGPRMGSMKKKKGKSEGDVWKQPTRLAGKKKPLQKWIRHKVFCDEKTRITIIGCTS